MLIYSQDEDLVININAVPGIEIETDYNEGNYKILCLCYGNSICIGEYDFFDRAERALNALRDAYKKKKRVFYIPKY